MKWEDEAIVLSTRPYGERASIVTMLTHRHGVHSGLVRGVKQVAVHCQPGYQVEVTWQARLEEQLGTFTVELRRPFSALLLHTPLPLSALRSACALVQLAVPEREPHTELYTALVEFCTTLEHVEQWPSGYLAFELELLRLLGYGLDLSCCAATGETQQLIYVSPMSGRAVSAAAGAPYKDKLLPLPAWLLEPEPEKAVSLTEMIDAIRLSSYFLEQYVFGSQRERMPAARDYFIQQCRNRSHSQV